MKNLFQEPVNLSEGKLLSSPICAFDTWPGGYCDAYGGEGRWSPDDGSGVWSQKSCSFKSAGAGSADLLSTDLFKTDLLPLDPFEMRGKETAPEIVGTSPEGDSFRIKDEFETDEGGDTLFPGFNWLYRGTIRFVPDMDFEESDERCEELTFKRTNQKLTATDCNEGVLKKIHEADLDAVSWGWGETPYRSDEMSHFEEHVFQGSALGNIVDMLPSDPFGMETATLVCRGRVRFMPEAENMDVDGSPNDFGFERVLMASDYGGLVDIGHEFDPDLASSSSIVHERQIYGESSHKHDIGEPNYAIFLALNYMGVKELLSMEKVCKSLNDAVKSNPSLWKNIHVDCPLNGVLTDDALMQLASRASGHLESLTLVGCFKITDMCIRYVINNNPRLTKLSIPGCFNLSIDGILTTLKSAEVLSIKQLRVGGLAGITNEQLEELQILLSANHYLGESGAMRPLYYHNRQSYLLSADDDRAIDIEKCPKCSKVRLVYDCPAESCQKESSVACKACILCISRCIGCGSCLTERDYVETFVLDAICSQCWSKIFGRPEKGTQESLSVLNQPVMCGATSYFCFYG